jgi:hypothetical protein
MYHGNGEGLKASVESLFLKSNIPDIVFENEQLKSLVVGCRYH